MEEGQHHLLVGEIIFGKNKSKKDLTSFFPFETIFEL
jgi:hypothetical protein